MPWRGGGVWAWVGARLHQPDHFDWMVGYLQARGLGARVRWLTAWATVSLSVLPITMLFSPSGPQGRWPRAMVIAASGCVLISALLWGRRWPSRGQSIGYAAVASVAIAVVCVNYSAPGVGLIGCTTFAMIGGYIAFFHSAGLQAVNLVVGLCTASVVGVSAVRSSGDVVATINVYVVVVVAIVALSVVSQVIVHVLGVDLNASDIDPLCGLLNRRAFHRHTQDLLVGGSAPVVGRPVCLAMIDLDDFKALNDTRGHRVGDAALIVVSALLTDSLSETAVAARIGGEEFVIVELTDPGSASTRATALCEAIAATEFGITASIGLASTTAPCPPSRDARAFIEDLMDLADTAMYEAKRAGGHQVRWATPPRDTSELP